MPNFIEDDVTLGSAKTDNTAIGSGDPTKHIQASDWNEHRTALQDIKEILRGEATYTNLLGAVADGATITGDGTAAAPLVATAPVADQDTIIGAGTVGSPFIAVGAAPNGDALLDSLKFSFPLAAITIPAGSHNDWDSGADDDLTSWPVECGFGGSTLTGILPSPHGRGHVVTLQVSMPGQPLTLKHMSESSLATSRIVCPDERDLYLGSGAVAILQSLNDGTHGWRVLSPSSSLFLKADAQYSRLGRINIGAGGGSTDITAGSITPTIANEQTNNWNPTGFLAAGRIRVAGGGASCEITGMAGINEGIAVGDVKIITAFAQIKIMHQHGDSAASRRFYLHAASITVAAGGSVSFVYDDLQYWVPFAGVGLS